MLDRDAARFTVSGEDVSLEVSEGPHKTSIDIDPKSLDEPGASALASALSK